jgi:hypothetical protein
MFRAALVALVEALVLAETVFGGAAGASSGPAAENVALPPLPGTPTDLQLHWLSFWRHSCGLPNGRGCRPHESRAERHARLHHPSGRTADTRHVVSIAARERSALSL